MKQIYRLLTVLIVLATLVACKSDTKKDGQDETQVKTDSIVKKERKIPTEEEKAQTKSVMAGVMMQSELGTFASHLVTAELTDMLLKEKGPFTIFAPTNEAFEQLDQAKQKSFLNPKNRVALVNLLKGHVVNGNFDLAKLIENTKVNRGKFQMQTISGDTLMVSKSGNKIVITNAKGVKATIEKSDISGNNGMIHTLNGVLLLN
jgi:uncharacterized surface protein with fasciclin (FAS1) repeats